ncbi:PAS domain S-box protein [Bosea thiooxidans]
MAPSFWSWPIVAGALLVLSAAFAILRLLRQRAKLRRQVSNLSQDAETLNDRLWSLADSEERYRSLIEAQGDLIVRREGARIVYANRAYAVLFGASEVDLVGSNSASPARQPAGAASGGGRAQLRRMRRDLRGRALDLLGRDGSARHRGTHADPACRPRHHRPHRG